jgi:hypothetical protein
MGTFKIEGVTHWSIPVNNLKESEEFYGGVLGLELLGRLSNGVMTCFITTFFYASGKSRRTNPSSKNACTIRSMSARKDLSRLARRFTKRKCPSLNSNTAPKAILPGASFIFMIRAATASRFAIPLGRKACPSRASKNL